MTMDVTDSSEKTVRMALGFFVLVVVGSLVAALLGGGFGAVIAMISPEFVIGLFSLEGEGAGVVRYAFTVGLIWGLFLGVAVSCFACLLSAILKILRLRIEHVRK